MECFRSSVCEFTFTWLSQYKHQTKHMSQFTFNFFLLEMIDAHNDRIRKGRTDHLPRARRADRWAHSWDSLLSDTCIAAGWAKHISLSHHEKNNNGGGNRKFKELYKMSLGIPEGK